MYSGSAIFWVFELYFPCKLNCTSIFLLIQFQLMSTQSLHLYKCPPSIERQCISRLHNTKEVKTQPVSLPLEGICPKADRQCHCTFREYSLINNREIFKFSRQKFKLQKPGFEGSLNAGFEFGKQLGLTEFQVLIYLDCSSYLNLTHQCILLYRVTSGCVLVTSGCVFCTDEQWRFAVVDRTQSNLQFFKEQELFHAADAKAVDMVS